MASDQEESTASSNTGNLKQIATDNLVKTVISPQSQLVTVHLDEQNYLLWKLQIETAIQGYGLEDFIQGTALIPPINITVCHDVEHPVEARRTAEDQQPVISDHQMNDCANDLSHAIYSPHTRAQPEAAAPIRHHMVTRAKSGIFKPKVYTADISQTEPATFEQAATYQRADTLTKALSARNFVRFRAELGITEINEEPGIKSLDLSSSAKNNEEPEIDSSDLSNPAKVSGNTSKRSDLFDNLSKSTVKSLDLSDSDNIPKDLSKKPISLVVFNKTARKDKIQSFNIERNIADIKEDELQADEKSFFVKKSEARRNSVKKKNSCRHFCGFANPNPIVGFEGGK